MRKKSKGDTWDGVFADPEVGRVLKAKGRIADANKSSIEELATIKTLSAGASVNHAYFYDNKVLTKFPELKYCTGLSSLRYAFFYCSNLTEVGNIPEGVTNMSYTFGYCTRLTKAPIISNSVTDMEGTFEGCRNLINAPIIPDSVISMSRTFYGCTRLNGIFVIKRITPPTYSRTFYDTKVVAIYVPDQSVSTYKRALGWSEFVDKIYPISDLPK